MNLSTLCALAPIAHEYAMLRRSAPLVPARVVLAFCRGAGGASLAQLECEMTVGHKWAYTGTAYGGDDESYRGEGRAYCCICGADGDA